MLSHAFLQNVADSLLSAPSDRAEPSPQSPSGVQYESMACGCATHTVMNEQT